VKDLDIFKQFKNGER